jgi:hypothetical protein
MLFAIICGLYFLRFLIVVISLVVKSLIIYKNIFDKNTFFYVSFHVKCYILNEYF